MGNKVKHCMPLSQRGKRQKKRWWCQRSVRKKTRLVLGKGALTLPTARTNAPPVVKGPLIKGRVDTMILRSDLVVKDSPWDGWREEILTKISTFIAMKIALATTIMGVTTVVKMVKCL